MKYNFKKNCYNIRNRILELSQKVGAIHIGGSFSSVEIAESVYFFLKKKKDKFILSKGHVGVLQYVILEKLNVLKKKDLNLYCKSSGFLGVHPDYGNPGINASTGSLGHGLGLAAGMALSTRYLKNKYYVLISDGELMEGSTWEMALTIPKLKLNNIILLIDSNNFQSSDKISATHPNLYPIDRKFKEFGWGVATCNGHDSLEIIKKIRNKNISKPFVLVCKTIKGFPVSFMMNNPIWHYRSPNEKELIEAKKDLENYYKSTPK